LVTRRGSRSGRSNRQELTILTHHAHMIHERAVVVHKELVPLRVGEQVVTDLANVGQDQVSARARTRRQRRWGPRGTDRVEEAKDSPLDGEPSVPWVSHTVDPTGLCKTRHASDRVSISAGQARGELNEFVRVVLRVLRCACCLAPLARTSETLPSSAANATAARAPS
jgi:hypothetical protein